MEKEINELENFFTSAGYNRGTAEEFACALSERFTIGYLRSLASGSPMQVHRCFTILLVTLKNLKDGETEDIVKRLGEKKKTDLSEDLKTLKIAKESLLYYAMCSVDSNGKQHNVRTCVTVLGRYFAATYAHSPHECWRLNDRIEIYSSVDGHKIMVEVINVSPYLTGLDFILLKSILSYEFCSEDWVVGNASRGAPMVALGFSHWDVLTETAGNIVAITPYGDMTTMLVSGGAWEGFSGGIVIANEKVVGMILGMELGPKDVSGDCNAREARAVAICTNYFGGILAAMGFLDPSFLTRPTYSPT